MNLVKVDNEDRRVMTNCLVGAQLGRLQHMRLRAVRVRRKTPTFKGEIGERERGGERGREGSAGRGFLKWVCSEFGEERAGERWGRVCDYDSSSLLVDPYILLIAQYYISFANLFHTLLNIFKLFKLFKN